MSAAVVRMTPSVQVQFSVEDRVRHNGDGVMGRRHREDYCRWHCAGTVTKVSPFRVVVLWDGRDRPKSHLAKSLEAL